MSLVEQRMYHALREAWMDYCDGLVTGREYALVAMTIYRTLVEYGYLP